MSRDAIDALWAEQDVQLELVLTPPRYAVTLRNRPRKGVGHGSLIAFLQNAPMREPLTVVVQREMEFGIARTSERPPRSVACVFLRHGGNAPNGRVGSGASCSAPPNFRPSHTPPVIPGGSHACVARVRFTG